jgi:hypothetical protein
VITLQFGESSRRRRFIEVSRSGHSSQKTHTAEAQSHKQKPKEAFIIKKDLRFLHKKGCRKPVKTADQIWSCTTSHSPFTLRRYYLRKESDAPELLLTFIDVFYDD